MARRFPPLLWRASVEAFPAPAGSNQRAVAFLCVWHSSSPVEQFRALKKRFMQTGFGWLLVVLYQSGHINAGPVIEQTP